MHVLILNTHPLNAQFIQKGLRYENIGADTCYLENLFKIWYGQYDALIIPLKSWRQPDFNEILNSIHKLGPIPTIITARTDPPEQIQTKLKEKTHAQFIGGHLPFRRLVSHIQKSRLSQNGEDQIRTLTIDELRINLETREAKRSKRRIALRNKEFSLLESLMRNPGKVLTRTFILENVWDRNTSILSNTVDVHVNRLRQKVDHGFDYSMIQTVPCIGYKILSENEIERLKRQKTK